jgi:hypothetical protein
MKIEPLEDVVEDAPDDDRVGYDADEAFDRLRREHSAMSGRVASHGYRRSTAVEGNGARKSLGRRPPTVAELEDDGSAQTIIRLLGGRRIMLLRRSLTSPRRPKREESAARCYLALMLAAVDTGRVPMPKKQPGMTGEKPPTPTEIAAALLLDAPPRPTIFKEKERLLRRAARNADDPRERADMADAADFFRELVARDKAARKKAFRSIGDLRRADYPSDLLAKAENELRAELGRIGRKAFVRESGRPAPDRRFQADRASDNT